MRLGRQLQIVLFPCSTKIQILNPKPRVMVCGGEDLGGYLVMMVELS